MIGWVYLLGAIVAEVSATAALRACEGFTRPLPSAGVVAGYVVAFALLSRTLDHLPLGVAYAAWAGLGTGGAVLAGWYLYGERVGWSTLFGVALVMTGIALLQADRQADRAAP
ncbi:MAG: multidrug efflux SMR transporter [Myxococcota bacterium]